MRNRSQSQYHEKDSSRKESKDHKYETRYFSDLIPVSKNRGDGSFLIKFVKPVAF
jgi:hypothetical protein